MARGLLTFDELALGLPTSRGLWGLQQRIDQVEQDRREGGPSSQQQVCEAQFEKASEGGRGAGCEWGGWTRNMRDSEVVDLKDGKGGKRPGARTTQRKPGSSSKRGPPSECETVSFELSPSAGSRHPSTLLSHGTESARSSVRYGASAGVPSVPSEAGRALGGACFAHTQRRCQFRSVLFVHRSRAVYNV